MTGDTTPPRGPFRFGDQVRIHSGAFAGMAATLLSPKEAKERRFTLPVGMLFVVVVIFGREVPVALDPWEVDTIEGGRV